jgi:hypothetical protein
MDDRAYWVPFVNVDPRFDDLRGDVRFQGLLVVRAIVSA